MVSSDGYNLKIHNYLHAKYYANMKIEEYVKIIISSISLLLH